jgi:hypothetical protein
MAISVQSGFSRRAQLLGTAAIAFWMGIGAGSATAAEFESVIALSSLSGAQGLRLDGILEGEESGVSVASAGDVNSDGFDDVIIGANGSSQHGNSSGSAYVVFGSATQTASSLSLSTLTGANGFRIDGLNAYDGVGVSVSMAGDVNGDGLSDVIVGAFGVDGSESDAGAAFVVFGRKAGFPPVLDVTQLNGSNGFRLSGSEPSGLAGFSVGGAGDVNGDGMDDMLAGAVQENGSASYSGAAYVVFGKTTAFASELQLSALNGSDGFKLNGVETLDAAGWSVSSRGDVNGDSIFDIVVSARLADGLRGSTFVVFGKDTGFSSIIDLSSLNGSDGFRLVGETTSDVNGNSAAVTGDINGDGFDDVISGAPYGNEASNPTGRTYVVFGKPSGFTAAIDASALNGGTGFAFNGVANTSFGRRVSGAGDLNGDGYEDIITAAPGSPIDSAYVMFGKSSGFSALSNVSTLDGSNGFRLSGDVLIAQFVGEVAPAGDFNGDGFGDVIVGARDSDNPISNTGSSFIVFGRAPDDARTRVGSATGQYISGGAFADTIIAADGNDVIEGRGGADVNNGGNGSDMASYAHAPDKVTASLAAPGGNTGDAAGDSYTDVENLEGSAFGDILKGNAAGNIIAGGKGADKQTGGKGKDVFRLRLASESPAGSGKDTITDFNPGKSSTSVDKIDVSAIDAKSAVNGNQAFKFRGTQAFTGAGQLRLKKTSAGIVVQGNTGGSKAPEFEILLKGLSSTSKITAKDFRL